MKNKREVTSSLSSWAAVKYFLTYFLPSMMLFSCVAIVLYNKDARSDRRIFESNEIHNVNLQMEIITREFEPVVADLMWLAGMAELQRMFAGYEAKAARIDLMNACLMLCKVKRFYGQIRVLDATGMEVIRVDFKNSGPCIVPTEQLQSKANRYYFKRTLMLGPEEVYISPFDLNVEQGQIERPLKPMLRFGTPVFDSHGSKLGIVLLNYLGAKVQAALEKSHVEYPGEIMLLNSDGFWLHSPNPEDEWGFMFKDKRNRTFGKAFPEAWLRIIAAESGQFHNADGLFTFATVYPLLHARQASPGVGKAIAAGTAEPEAKPYGWKIVSRVSPDVLNAGPQKFLSRLLQISTALTVLLGIASGLLARARMNREQTEQALRESEAKFRALLESAFEAIVIVDSQGGIVLVNHKTEEMFGYDRGELLGQTVEILLPERFRNGHIEQRADYISSPRRRPMGADLALFGLRKNGTEFPADIGLSYADIHGEIFSISCITDITERKRAAEEVRSFKTISDNANYGTAIADLQGNITYVNEWFAGMHGYTIADLIGKHLSIFHSEDQMTEVNRLLDQIKQKGGFAFEEVWHKRKDGTVFPTLMSATLIKDDKENPQFMSSTAIDITEQKRAEEQIKNQNVLLEQAVLQKQREMDMLMERLIRREKLAAIGEISGSIAHELRNPLSAIRQSIFFLRRLYNTNKITSSHSKMQEHLELLETEIETSDRVIADLLQRTKMTPLEKEEMNLRSVVLEAVQRCHMDDRIQLEIALNPEPFMLWAEPLQIRQVFINLLSNATQAIPQKGVVTVQARMLNDGKACLIEIQDNGAGIEPRQLSKVFEPLYSTKAKGTGLGLSICKQIIENHDGTITVNSQVERGTTVIIELPCVG